MQAIVIEPNKPPLLREIGGYDDLVAIVGGYLEAVAFTPETVAYVDEEAKVRGDRRPAVNALATHLCNAVGTPLGPGDWIAGTMVLVGTLDEDGRHDGEDHDLPQGVIDAVAAACADFAGVTPIREEGVDV